MKYYIGKDSFVGACLLLLASSSAMAMEPLGFTPYLGADAAVRHMKWAPGLGDNLYRHDYPQGNVYGGLKLQDYMGVEAGYELTPTKTRQVALSANQTILGQPSPVANGATLWNTKMQIKGWHADLLGFCPIFCEEYRFSLVGGVGVTRAKLYQTAYMTANSATGASNPFLTFNTMSASKSMLRLSAGGQHMMSEDYGVRFLVGWLNSSKFGRMISQQQPLNAVNVKNSWQYGLGLFVKF